MIKLGPRVLLVAGGLCLVLAVNGYPLVFPDSGTYVRQALRLEGALDRPPFYSIFLVPLHLTVTLWAIPVIQDLVSAAIVLRALSIAFPSVGPARLTVAAVLTVLTSSWPFFSNQIMPDIFTPMIVLLAYCLGIGYARLARVERILMTGALAAFCAFHSASPLFAVALAGVSVVLLWWTGAPRSALVRTTALIAGPAFLAILGQTAYGYALTGQVTPAPNRSMFLLARLLDDGPAKRYLEAKCPGAGFVLCRDPSSIKGDYGTMLWTDTSPIAELIRTRGPLGAIVEASAIVDGTIKAYPLQVLGHAVVNATQQFLQFRTANDDCPCTGMKIDRVVTEFFPREHSAFAGSLQNRTDLPWSPLGRLHVAIVALGYATLAGFVVLRRSALAGGPGLLIALVVSACIINAAIMGGLSGVADRYQARIVWLIPLLAFTLLLGRRPRAPSRS